MVPHLILHRFNKPLCTHYLWEGIRLLGNYYGPMTGVAKRPVTTHQGNWSARYRSLHPSKFYNRLADVEKHQKGHGSGWDKDSHSTGLPAPGLDWGKMVTKVRRRRQEGGAVWPYHIWCTVTERRDATPELKPEKEQKVQRQQSRGSVCSSHGGGAQSRARWPRTRQVRASIYTRLLSMLMYNHVCRTVHANVYTDSHAGPTPPGGWGVRDPQPGVSIGFLDGFAHSHPGPDLHQEHWGQMGGGICLPWAWTA